MSDETELKLVRDAYSELGAQSVTREALIRSLEARVIELQGGLEEAYDLGYIKGRDDER